jgi:uncharacterized membrane protein YedE/YeeE
MTPGVFRFAVMGTIVGFVFVRSEVISWFRIQEMFRFDAIHMYGIIGSAVVVSAVSLVLIRRLNIRTIDGNSIELPEKVFKGWGARYWLGGLFFGLGWGLLGACPGPIFVLIGSGSTVVIAALASALAGTWFYGLIRDYLPH